LRIIAKNFRTDINLSSILRLALLAMLAVRVK